MKEINTAKNSEIEKEQVLLENKELTEYLDFMEETLVCRSCSSNLENVGRNASLVGERHRRRKVKELKNRSEQALWFMDSFGSNWILSKSEIQMVILKKWFTKTMILAIKPVSSNCLSMTKIPFGPFYILWTSIA